MINYKTINHPTRKIATGETIDIVEEIKSCAECIYNTLIRYETLSHRGNVVEALQVYKLYIEQRDFFTAQVESDELEDHHKIECYEKLISVLRRILRHECEYYKIDRRFILSINKYLTMVLTRVISLEERHSIYEAHLKSYKVFEEYYLEEKGSEKPDQHLMNCYLIIMSKIKNKIILEVK